MKNALKQSPDVGNPDRQKSSKTGRAASTSSAWKGADRSNRLIRPNKYELGPGTGSIVENTPDKYSEEQLTDDSRKSEFILWSKGIVYKINRLR